MRKFKLDWSAIDCEATENLFKTKAEVRQLRQNLENSTDDLFDKYEQDQRKAWENASGFFLD